MKVFRIIKFADDIIAQNLQNFNIDLNNKFQYMIIHIFCSLSTLLQRFFFFHDEKTNGYCMSEGCSVRLSSNFNLKSCDLIYSPV